MEQAALVEHVKAHLQIYKHKVLRPEVHHRLVQDLPRIALTANIPPTYIYTSMVGTCGPQEVDWVRTLKNHHEHNIAGMAFVGMIPNVEDRMMHIAGACIRNYLDARVMTVQEVIEKQKAGAMPEPRVLLIPNFFLKKDSGGDIPSWQVSSLLGLLYSRFAKQLHTVLYVQNLHSLAEAYGVSFSGHIQSHYTLVSAAA